MKNKEAFDKQSSLKKKILLIYTSSVVSPLAQPHGAAIIANVLKKAGFEVRLVCPFWNSKVELSLSRELNDFSPDLIGISIRNHGTAGFDYRKTAEKSFYPEIKRIIEICNTYGGGGIPIILGGSGFSVDPQRYMDIQGVSAGLMGNSEQDLKKFAVNLLNYGKSVEESAVGVASFVLPGKITSTILPSGIEPGDYDAILCPEGIKAALSVGGTIPFRTKTGCGGKCIYCVMPLIEGRNFRSPKHVVDEIRMLVEYHLGSRLFCADSEFGQDPEHDKAVCLSINKGGLEEKIRISGYGDPFFMDKSMVALMRRAGWKDISVSVDSFSPKIRKMYGKRGSVVEVERGISNLLNAGIRVTVNILLGGPGETIQTISETLAVLEKWKEKSDICFTFGLTVFSHTPLEKIAKQKKHKEYLLEGNGDILPSFCSPCAPKRMVELVKSKGFYPTKDNGVIFWNEEADFNTVEFTRKIIRIASGNNVPVPEPKSVLQQMMLKVAKIIQKGGE